MNIGGLCEIAAATTDIAITIAIHIKSTFPKKRKARSRNRPIFNTAAPVSPISLLKPTT